MSIELNNRVIELERRVAELETFIHGGAFLAEIRAQLQPVSVEVPRAANVTLKLPKKANA